MVSTPRDTDAVKLDALRVLGEHSVLRRLPPEDLRTLLRQATVQAVAERGIIFAQGDQGRNVLIVVRGFVKLSSLTLNGREVVLDLAGPGDVFGELAVLNDWPRAATATALSSVILLLVDGQQFTKALSQAPAAMMGVIHLLSRRLRKATEQMTDGIELPAPARLAKALLQLAALHSRPVTGGLQIELQLSQRELGGMTGLIRESINKHLGVWRDAGWLRLTDRSITLRDLSAFHDLLREHELD
jgi:CRP/FNR family cyclic AMP-dependent transcriptional regulator